ncbi:tyrosine-protein phosphatase [Pseudomonas sp. 273]|uniref:tyrosine-protein phosphatase n=1 Tax=Pseudomonas sp. 273 TaxID=75692 RepID=UPI0023D824C5|nr:tyrosine-protein phosphatase [Pseudomonas sp. 273]
MSESAAARLLLESVPNFRDLGGYRTRCGRCVRPGLLYRSEDLSNLSPEDLDRFRELNIKMLCDVRSASEQQRTPNRLPRDHRIDIVSLDILADLRAGNSVIHELLSSSPTAESAERAMLATYRLFPGAFAKQLPLLLDYLLNQNLPLLFHCAAGKDRTGFIAALLLHILDVPWESIYLDYLASADRWQGPRSEATIRGYLAGLSSTEPDQSVVRILCGVKPAYLDAAFDALIEQYGSIENYLALAGVQQTELLHLRDLLLE